MAINKNMGHPSFIIGVISFIFFILGIGLRANGFRAGDYVLASAIALGAVHWIWSIIDVARMQGLGPQSRIFWLILVVIIPPVGGMCFYMMRRKNISL